tara:strand:+ start:171 stop:509 length:339 start_codon:yes stop_codon:yes gene_type:complete
MNNSIKKKRRQIKRERKAWGRIGLKFHKNSAALKSEYAPKENTCMFGRCFVKYIKGRTPELSHEYILRMDIYLGDNTLNTTVFRPAKISRINRINYHFERLETIKTLEFLHT